MITNDTTGTVEITRAVLYPMLRAVAPYMSKDTTRLRLHGMLLEREGHVVRLVANNGHTLAKAEGKAPSDSSESYDFPQTILPFDAIKTLIALVKPSKVNGDEIVQIDVDVGSVQVRCGGGTQAFKAIDSSFPPHGQVTPEKVDLDREDRAIVAMDPKYVERAAKSVKVFGAEDLVLQVGTTPLDPVRVDAKTDLGTLCVVIMPRRIR